MANRRRSGHPLDVADPAPIPSPRALVVEDAASLRTLLSILLRRQGYQVITVDHGDDAVAAAMQGVELILLDLGLPGTNGLEVCRRLQAESATSAVPVIVVTGRTHPDDVRDALKAGATDVLTKPFSEADLVAALARLSEPGRVAANSITS
jgi:DNA-binding response OmpR family regulator